jgi:hypothetical protein
MAVRTAVPGGSMVRMGSPVRFLRGSTPKRQVRPDPAPGLLHAPGGPETGVGERLTRNTVSSPPRTERGISDPGAASRVPRPESLRFAERRMASRGFSNALRGVGTSRRCAVVLDDYGSSVERNGGGHSLWQRVDRWREVAASGGCGCSPGTPRALALACASQVPLRRRQCGVNRTRMAIGASDRSRNSAFTGSDYPSTRSPTLASPMYLGRAWCESRRRGEPLAKAPG